MIDETTQQAEPQPKHDAGCGCGAQHTAPVAVDEKAAAEQAAREEAVRARNKGVRAPRTAPGPGGPPPFSDHSGTL